MSPGPTPIPSGHASRHYRGPSVVAAGGPRQARWVWVANALRPSEDIFRVPGPLADTSANLSRAATPSRPGDEPSSASSQGQRGSDGAGPTTGGDGRERDATDHTDVEPVATGSGVVVEVRVLGPVEVVGWRSPPERAVLTELACYLALHPGRPIPADELRAALRPAEDHETSAKTLRTYMSLLRRSLGPDLVPQASGAGYRLSPGVTTDWHRFCALAGTDATPDSALQALTLVRGRPFAGVASGTFEWIYAELLVSEMEVAIAKLASRIADTALAAGDVTRAAWATRQGLLGVPSDVGLWQAHLGVAARIGPESLERARRDASAALGPDATLVEDPRHR